MPKLTKSLVDALMPTGRRYVVHDSSLPGFHVRVNANGTKTACLAYRTGSIKRRLTLGKLHDAYSFAQARKDAADALVAVKAGRDPAVERKATRGAPTFTEAAERFLAETRERCKPATVLKYGDIIQHQLTPALGKLKVSDIGETEARRLHSSLASRPVLANYALTVLSAIMERAAVWGWRAKGSNPTSGIDRHPQGNRSRVLTDDERARLVSTLDEAERDGIFGAGYIAAIRLLMLTAARSGEIVGLQWAMVDLERSCLRLPDSKTGPRVVPLPAQVVAILAALRQRRGSSPWVCASGSGGPLRSLRQSWSRLRLRAGLPDVRLHDLRRSAATDAIRSGVPLPVVGRSILGHRSTRTTEIYFSPDDADGIAAAQAMADAIDAKTAAGKLKTEKKDQ